MIWMAYARTGQEFAVQAAIEALGLAVYLPRKIEAIRRGNRRFPDAVTTPLLPNYIFFDATPDQWHSVKAVKHLSPAMTPIARAYVPRLMQFVSTAETAYRDRLAKIEAGERVEQFQPGDVMAILSGPLQGQFARFRRLVESPGDMFPQIEADVSILGHTVRARLDVLSVGVAK